MGFVSDLSERRNQTSARIVQLREHLKAAESLGAGKACVYATGSFGRCEASKHSDLDLFILGKVGRTASGEITGNLLRRLDEICIKAELIEATRKLGIRDFSGDGRYLVHYSINDLTKTLGKPEDDATNTFTARLLLLLESRPLMGEAVYKELTEEVIGAYWKDYTDHKNDFMPAFLANDILRLWRTFCVNYEAGTERVPEEKKAEGKLKNYKLKHSRLLTCYSALLYLLAVHRQCGTVSPGDASTMIQLMPTERLEWLLNQRFLSDAWPKIAEVTAQYEKFLEATNAAEADLLSAFADKEKSRTFMAAAYEFGDLIFDLLKLVSAEDLRFYRFLVV